MKCETEATGRTVEDAVAAACVKLGAARDTVTVEVLEKPSKRLLGLLGGSDARVRVTAVQPPKARAAAYLDGVLARMGLEEYEIVCEEKDGGLSIDIRGERLGLVIGHRGATLDALQYLTALAANHGEETFEHVSLECGDYRKKREKTLSALARRMAQAAVRTRRSTTLEPMNPYERRIVHTAVQEIKGAASWSVGEEPNRRVVIGIEKRRRPAVQQAQAENEG